MAIEHCCSVCGEAVEEFCATHPNAAVDSIAVPVKKLDIKVIALDESAMYSIEIIDAEDKPFIEGLYSIYFYDKNQHTYLCEMQPSYYLIHVEDQVRFNAEGEKLSESEKERFYNKYQYNYNENDQRYMHVSDIDALEEKLSQIPYRFHSEGEEELPEDVTYDDAIDAIAEDLSANARL